MIALARFLAGAGGRIALAAAVPVAGILVIALGLQPDPGGLVARMAESLAGSPPSPWAVVLLFAASLAAAHAAMPRVALGLDGWMRHLPVSTSARRAALIGVLAWTQVPLTSAALACAVLESLRGGRIAWPGFVLPPLVALAAACLRSALPSDRSHRPASRSDGAVLFARIALRALGARLTVAWIVGAFPLAAAALFVANNPSATEMSSIAARLGGGLAATFTLAAMADELAVKRPAWPWARSLPTSATRRVAVDAGVLALGCFPWVVALAAVDPLAAPVILPLLILLALRAASAMRRGVATSGPVLLEGALASALIALVPWLAMALPAAWPLALRAAARRDRALRVTRWNAMRHDAAGDTA
jgi:hypothetical protein